MPSLLETLPNETTSSLAGRPGTKEMLVDLAQLEREYFNRRPELSDPNQMVAFGTSGHRGSPLADEPIISKVTRAPGNNEPIDGLKVTSVSGWFAARPSGTENVYKIYAESFASKAHLNTILGEAQEIVGRALKSPKGQA